MNDPDHQFNRAARAGELCRECGLCCTGFLFDRVNIKSGDREIRTHLGLPQKFPEKIPLTHPCRYLDGTLCSIYEVRPQNCQKYQCALRRSVSSGETSLDQALQLTRDVKDLIAALDPLVEERLGRRVTESGFRAFCYDYIDWIQERRQRGITADELDGEIIRQTLAILKIADGAFRENHRLKIFAELLYDVTVKIP